MFLSRNKNNNVYPCKPTIYYIKVGFNGGQHYIGMISWWLAEIHWCLRMNILRLVHVTFKHFITVLRKSAVSDRKRENKKIQGTRNTEDCTCTTIDKKESYFTWRISTYALALTKNCIIAKFLLFSLSSVKFDQIFFSILFLRVSFFSPVFLETECQCRMKRKPIKLMCNVRKRTLGHVYPAKIQINLRIRTLCPESSLDAFWLAKDAKFLHGVNEDWSDCADVFAGCTRGTFSCVAAHGSR